MAAGVAAGLIWLVAAGLVTGEGWFGPAPYGAPALPSLTPAALVLAGIAIWASRRRRV